MRLFKRYFFWFSRIFFFFSSAVISSSAVVRIWAIAVCSWIDGIFNRQFNISSFLKFVCFTPSSKERKYLFLFKILYKNELIIIFDVIAQIRWLRVYFSSSKIKKHFYVFLFYKRDKLIFSDINSIIYILYIYNINII